MITFTKVKNKKNVRIKNTERYYFWIRNMWSKKNNEKYKKHDETSIFSQNKLERKEKIFERKRESSGKKKIQIWWTVKINSENNKWI